MIYKTIRFPINSVDFNESLRKKVLLFLDEFFDENYECSFIFDDNGLYLQISKKILSFN